VYIFTGLRGQRYKTYNFQRTGYYFGGLAQISKKRTLKKKSCKGVMGKNPASAFYRPDLITDAQKFLRELLAYKNNHIQPKQ